MDVEVLDVQQIWWNPTIEAGAVFMFLYVLQIGHPDTEKEHFYGQLQGLDAGVPSLETLIPIGDWNGHVSACAGGFEEVQGYGVQNTEGDRVLEFDHWQLLDIEESHPVTFNSGDHRSDWFVLGSMGHLNDDKISIAVIFSKMYCW